MKEHTEMRVSGNKISLIACKQTNVTHIRSEHDIGRFYTRDALSVWTGQTFKARLVMRL